MKFLDVKKFCWLNFTFAQIRLYYILSGYIYELCSKTDDDETWTKGEFSKQNIQVYPGTGLSAVWNGFLQVYYTDPAGRISVYHTQNGHWQHDVVSK